MTPEPRTPSTEAGKLVVRFLLDLGSTFNFTVVHIEAVKLVFAIESEAEAALRARLAAEVKTLADRVGGQMAPNGLTAARMNGQWEAYAAVLQVITGESEP